MTDKDKKILITDKLLYNKLKGNLFGDELQKFKKVLEDNGYYIINEYDTDTTTYLEYYNENNGLEVILYPEIGIADIDSSFGNMKEIKSIEEFLEYHRQWENDKKGLENLL